MAVSRTDGGDVMITDPITGSEQVLALGARRLTHRVGDVDGRPGAEVVTIADLYYADDDVLSVYGDGFSRHRALGPDLTGIPPWITDLRGDGKPEILLGTRIVAPSGRLIARWGQTNTYRSAAVDLDLDGVPEVLTGKDDEAGRFTPQGLTVCAGVFGGWQYFKNFAAGNLDGDPLGEFVVQVGPIVGVCDTTGAPIAVVDLGIGWDMVGLGDLQGDATPEVVLSALGTLQVLGFGAGSTSWSVPGEGYTYFALADVDADGRQEIVVLQDHAVVLYDGDGTELSRTPTSFTNSIGSGPAVADFDGDGLAEIAVGTDHLVILENADGGFDIPGAELGWIGRGHFPGVMRADGSIHLGGGAWRDPARNVWQGHAACDP